MAQCKAKARSGARCKQPAIDGGAVCRYHGGAAPQVLRSAKERLAAMVDPALARLVKLLKTRDDKTAYRAVKDVLDRNGFKPPDKQELTGANGEPVNVTVRFVRARAPGLPDEPLDGFDS